MLNVALEELLDPTYLKNYKITAKAHDSSHPSKGVTDSILFEGTLSGRTSVQMKDGTFSVRSYSGDTEEILIATDELTTDKISKIRVTLSKEQVEFEKNARQVGWDWVERTDGVVSDLSIVNTGWETSSKNTVRPLRIMNSSPK